tara:strand:- start:2128 stop:2256 length:129 start_codon:yes stop_codon:yes gene_type:complete
METLINIANYPIPNEIRTAILIGCVIGLIAIVIIPTKKEQDV